ncbi:regulator [Pseudomonas syringae group sp. J254-4]|uniref:regulator n=1 Tax=Pseudomonas syringae group sp. J254-4 TaxID=3079589 RepID=UPI0029156702|nr:regulator [Pseudomonas syringae group sp. J254-4]MDU8456801.1 regulator [Pseudomonas syringae group sp. J254-4]
MSNYAAIYSSSQNSEITKRVDVLYSEACREYPTYETLVFEHFCSQMIETFGDDELAPEAADAFSYARSDYDYRSPSEIMAAREVNRSHGICSHGLTKDTCPCGCFEFTGQEVYEDYGPDECEPIDADFLVTTDPTLAMSDEEWELMNEQWRQQEILEASRPIRTFLKTLWIKALNLSTIRQR